MSNEDSQAQKVSSLLNTSNLKIPNPKYSKTRNFLNTAMMPQWKFSHRETVMCANTLRKLPSPCVHKVYGNTNGFGVCAWVPSSRYLIPYMGTLQLRKNSQIRNASGPKHFTLGSLNVYGRRRLGLARERQLGRAGSVPKP
jgi:hypothetical protein